MEARIRGQVIRLTICEQSQVELFLIIWKSSYNKTMFTWCLMLRQLQPNKTIVVSKILLTKAFNWIHRLPGRELHLKIRNHYNWLQRMNIAPSKGPKLKQSQVISCTVQARGKNSSIRPQQRLISYRLQRTPLAMFTCQVQPLQGSKSPQGNLLFPLAQVKLALLMRLMVLRIIDVPVEITWMLLISDRIIKVKRGPS